MNKVTVRCPKCNRLCNSVGQCIRNQIQALYGSKPKVRKYKELHTLYWPGPFFLYPDREGSVDLLNFSFTGTEDYNRIGNVILMKSVLIRFQIEVALQTGDFRLDQAVRFMLVYDKQPNLDSSTAVITDILSASEASPTTWAHNLNNLNRFITLHDEVFDCSVHKITMTEFHVFKRIHLRTVYEDEDGFYKRIVTGALLGCYVSNFPAHSGHLEWRALLNGNVVVRFEDS